MNNRWDLKWLASLNHATCKPLTPIAGSSFLIRFRPTCFMLAYCCVKIRLPIGTVTPATIRR
ncbi:MAG: hypothetical protein KME26_19570 [Oscillatoria princeps RMCB-10]|nr:hypothetical protein [Oscillatoria princeps RMCB-10]